VVNQPHRANDLRDNYIIKISKITTC